VEEVRDEASGKMYFFNKHTGKTGWTREEVMRTPELKGPVRGGGSGGGGSSAGGGGGEGAGMGDKTQSVLSAVDPATGRAYFFNQFSQKTGWGKQEVSRAATNNEYGLDHGVEVDPTVDNEMVNPMFAQPRRQAGGGLTATHASRTRMT
jgi:hypothetical protein